MIISFVKQKQRTQGFTIIELIVSVAIIVAITSVVIFNQDDLGDQTALNNVVNDIDVQIREAQVYGISVKEFSSNSSSEFNIAYGVDFNISSGGNNSYFYTFADRGPQQNGYFDTFGTCNLGGTSECVGWNRLVRGNTITKLCMIRANDVSCSPNVGRIAISFYRPNPDARMVFFNSAGTNIYSQDALGARIEITSPKGKKKTVVVYKTGQIAIE